MPERPESYQPAQPDPELLRAFGEQCKLAGRLWRLKDEVRRAVAQVRSKGRR